MRTENQCDFKGYMMRFKLPSKRCFILPLKSAGIIFLLTALGSLLLFFEHQSWLIFISIMLSMLAVGYYIKVLYKDFWSVVLEESKGLFADLIMWMYYMMVCVLSLSPFFVLLWYLDILHQI